MRTRILLIVLSLSLTACNSAGPDGQTGSGETAQTSSTFLGEPTYAEGPYLILEDEEEIFVAMDDRFRGEIMVVAEGKKNDDGVMMNESEDEDGEVPMRNFVIDGSSRSGTGTSGGTGSDSLDELNDESFDENESDNEEIEEGIEDGDTDDDVTFTASGTLLRTSRGRCPANRSIVGAIFPNEEMTTGTDGFTFPGLINGDCPITAGILRVGTGDSPFGGLMDF